MKGDIVLEVIRTLIGNIEPIGETREDDKRFENLKNLTFVIERLLYDVDGIIPNKRRIESSMKRAGEYADKFFDSQGIKN